MENPYRRELERLDDEHHLIGMVSLRGILRLGYEIGLQKGQRVLDLCCGYGTVLKVWHEAFGIVGVGVDLCEEFISVGKKRLGGASDGVTLLTGDALAYQSDAPFDVVVMSETFDGIANTLALGESHLKKGGVLVYHRLYSRVPEPPQELIDFDIDIPALPALHETFAELGYYLIAMASDTDADWERYVLYWSGQRNLEALRARPGDESAARWAQKWQRIYFDCRRPCEGQALFALTRV